MAKAIKCKICGDTEFTEVGDLLQCRSCKHKTPKPKDNAELLERANNLRFETKSFDDAAALYEEIIRMTPDEAEAYWGRVLCRYGIEYVKDSDGKYLPTCHRTIEGSILDDGDYKMAVMKAEAGMSEYYMTEAKTIDEYQKKIKLIAAKEEPYDVFISFKATDDFGRPTEDSLLAQELYYYLTKNLGLKVFFSNITLKDKAGQEYEPIIYAALSSATVMVLVGTKPEHINATWVKNEWSRYVKMIATAKAQNKSKYIVTALKGMKPEQLPTFLAAYQAVDLAELGAKEKLCSNIDGLIGDLRVKSQTSKRGSVAIDANDMLSAEAANLCNLGFQQLTLNDFDKAEEYFQKALEKKSDSALALWGKLLISEGVADDAALAQHAIPIKEFSLYKLAIENATAEEKLRFEAVGRQCQASFERADAKTRHNNEYHTKVEELKYNYTKNLNNERVLFDEKADTLYNEYFYTSGKLSELQNTESRLRYKSSGIFRSLIVIVLAVLLLIVTLRCESIIDTVNQTCEPYLGENVIDIIRESDVSVGDLLNGDETTDWGLTEEQIMKLEAAEITDSALYNKIETDAFVVIGIFFVITAVTMITLLVIFASVKAALIATFLFGLVIAALLTAGAFVLAILVPSALPIASYGLLGLGVLLLVLKIVKKIKRKTALKALKAETSQLFARKTELQAAVADRATEQIAALNKEYYELFGNEIDEYEADDVIVKDVLNEKWKLA